MHKLFVDHNTTKTNKLNMMGLLNASLMTGDVIKDIAITCIEIYLETLTKSNKKYVMNPKYKS